jgi:general secretion pathway protein G
MMFHRRRRTLPAPAYRSQQGLTLVELIVAITIMAILALAALPMARLTVRREKERELRRDL